VAFVVPTEGSDVSLADLRCWATGSLADYKAPDRLAVVESLPLTSMMKVDKRALADRVDQAQPVHAVQVRKQ
jgi:non-ribosomal peptide synthetase component E (peptide arylation enzyme)